MLASAQATDVHWVDFSATEGGPSIGTYRQVSRTVWKEDSRTQGRDRFEFVETKRDRGSITLFDASRNVTIGLGLQRQTIFYNDDGRVLRPLYSITSMSSKATGWLVSTLEYGAGPAVIQGVFFQTDATTWAEQSSGGKVRFTFAETARDDWSVYLHDASRDTKVQLDLFRGKVLVGQGTTKPADFYSIVTSSAVVTGWLVNQVDVTAGSTAIAGTYRQSGPKTWVEDSVADGLSKFEFHETQRDDWSVYMRDDTRGVGLQLDLFKRKVFYSDAKTPWEELYSIAHADIQPRIGIENGRTATSVQIGDAVGNVQGTFRQTNAETWTEDSQGTGRDAFEFKEMARDPWSVYLFDASRDMSIQIDLFKGKVFFSDAHTSNTELYAVLNASSTLNGWLVNTVAVGDGQTITGALRQTGWTSWIEAGKDGAVFDFEETGRDDGSVTLHDASRGVALRVDLTAKKVYLTDATHTRSELYTVGSFGRDPEVWAMRNRITSRSAMTEDYVMKPGVKQPQAVPVYRTSVTLPPLTRFVDVWASEETTLTINETSYTVDAVRSVRVLPSRLSRLTISVAADDLHCPQILLRTNLMKPDNRHFILPDVEVHKKIVGLQAGAVNDARGQLGLPSSLSSNSADDLQKSIQNIAKLPQYSYNYTKNGVLRDRAVLPVNMDDPHFMLDFSSGGTRYTPLNKAQVLGHIQGARMLQPNLAQSVWDDIGGFFKQAGQIIVHTAVAVGGDAVDTAKAVGSAVVSTVDHVGEALVHGDILEAGKDLIEGGENIGGALVTGVTTAGGDILDGASQIVVITLKTAGVALQFVIDHTGVVGKAIGWLLEKAGAAIGKFVGWLVDKTDWANVLHTHDVIRDSTNHRLDELVGFTASLKAKSDKFFAQLADQVSGDIDRVIAAMEPAPARKPQVPDQSHSPALEQVEWLLGKLVHFGAGTGTGMAALPSLGPQAPLDGLAQLLEDEIGADGGKVQQAFGDAFDHLLHAFTDGSQTAQDLLIALLDVIKGTALIALHIVSKVIDAVLDLVAAMITGLKSLINETWDVPFVSDFYEGLTSRPMTILSILALLVAVPTTLISKALFNKEPFAGQGAALALAPQSDLQRNLGIAYGSCHLVGWVTAIVASGKMVSDKFDELVTSVDTALPPNPNEASSLTRFSFFLRAANFVVDFIALTTGLPVTPGADPFAVPEFAAQNDVLQAPNYWSHVLLAYNFCGWSFGVMASVWTTLGEKRGETKGSIAFGNDVICGLTGCIGLAQMGLAGALDYYDRAKRDALAKVDWQQFQLQDVKPSRMDAAKWLEGAIYGHKLPLTQVSQLTEIEVGAWIDGLKNYYAWGQDNELFMDKGFANVMDAFPSIGQFGLIRRVLQGSKGISFIVSALFDMLGHLGEGGAYIQLARNDALY